MTPPRPPRSRPVILRGLPGLDPTPRQRPRPRPQPQHRDAEAVRGGPSRTIAFHKPYGVLCQFTPDQPGQKTLADFDLPPGLYPVGRLDQDSEGLLLLSNNGRLIKHLLEPRFGHPRTYLVQVENIPTEEALDALRRGVTIRINKQDHHTLPARATLDSTEPDLPPRDPPVRYRAAIPTAWLRLTLTEGKNRQVRRMTAAVGFPTLRLIRVAIGALDLAPLAPGQWRDVTPEDIGL